jgi:hypothetical protein
MYRGEYQTYPFFLHVTHDVYSTPPSPFFQCFVFILQQGIGVYFQSSKNPRVLTGNRFRRLLFVRRCLLSVPCFLTQQALEAGRRQLRAAIAGPDATCPHTAGPRRYAPTRAAPDTTRPNMMIRVVTKIGINHGVRGVTRKRQDLQLKLRGTPYPPWFSSTPHPRPTRPSTATRPRGRPRQQTTKPVT